MKYGIGEDAHIFAVNSNKPSQFEIKISFNTKVSEEILVSATKKTMQIFTRMKYKPIIDINGDVKFVENVEGIPVFKSDNKIRNVGSKDTNYYLFFVMYDENDILLVINHFISDGVGIGFLLNYFLYQYICATKKEYYEDEFIKKLEDDKNVSKYDLAVDKSFEYAKSNNINLDGWSLSIENEKKYIYVFEKNYDNFESEMFYESRTIYDVSEMKAVIKKFDITPLMLFSILFNDAIIESKNVKEDVIKVGILVNLRNFLKSDSLVNFAGMTNLEYYTKYNSLPFEEKISKIKEIYKKSIDYEHIVIENAKMYDFLIKHNLKNNINKLIYDRKNKTLSSSPDMFSYTLTNIGNINISEKLRDEIKDITMRGALISLYPVLGLYSYKNKGTIMFAQNVLDDSIMELVVEKMKKIGITTKFNKSEKMILNGCDAVLFEREK